MNNRNSSSAAAALVLATLALAATQEEAQQSPAPSQVQQAKPVNVPEAERKRRNPVPPVPEAIESGRNLFSSQCSMCHGANGALDAPGRVKEYRRRFLSDDPGRRREVSCGAAPVRSSS